MKLDIRIPLGLMFLIFGLVLMVYGLFTEPEVYEKSMGINVNLWWGAVMAIFGGAFLASCYASRKSP